MDRFTVQVFVTNTGDDWSVEMTHAANDYRSLHVKTYKRSKTLHTMVGAVIVNPDESTEFQLTFDYFLETAEVVLPEDRVSAPDALSYLTTQTEINDVRYELESSINEGSRHFVAVQRAFPELGFEAEGDGDSVPRPIDVVISLRGAKLGEGLDSYFLDVERLSPSTYDLRVYSVGLELDNSTVSPAFIEEIFKYASEVLLSVFQAEPLQKGGLPYEPNA